MCLRVSQILLCLLAVQLIDSNRTLMEFKSVRRKELPVATDLTLKALSDCELGLVLVRSPSHMSMYYTGSSHGTLLWRKVLPGSVGVENVEQYPIGIITNIKFGNILVAKAESGLRFYKLENAPTFLPKPLFEDTKFSDLHGWRNPSTILRWGRIFPSQSHLGLLTRSNNGTIKFFAASLQSILDRDRFAVQELSPAEPIQIEKWWSHPTTDLQLVDLDGSGKQQVIVARGMNNFTIYKFDRKYQLEFVLSQDMFSKSRTASGRIIFANITGSIYRDILLFHSSGLYLSKYDHIERSYTAVGGGYIDFSEANGWTEMLTSSVNIFDLDATRQKSIIYHGPGGLEMARFFPESNGTWGLEQLKRDHVTQKEKHSYPLAACRNDQPWVLLESDDFELEMIEIGVEKLTVSTNPELAPNFTRSWTPRFPDEIESPVEQVWRNWFHIWDDPLVKNSDKLVELQTGHVSFTLPLFASDGVNLRSSYHSSRHQSGVMGVGWNLPLTNNFILMDPQSSTFEDLHSYYISLDGALLALNRNYELDSSTAKIYNVTNHNITASYYSSTKSWVVVWDHSNLVFGGSPGSLQESLVWPWGYAGKSEHLDQLKTQPVAWYLTRRQIESQTIQYKYGSKLSQVRPGKQYTSEIYLTEIVDVSDSVRVMFEYTSKQDSSCSSNSPNSPDGTFSFPVPLNQGLLLSAVIATTPTSKQLFNFSYTTTTSGKDILEKLTQFLISSGFSPLAKFEYNDVGLLSRIETPSTGVGVSLQYQKDNFKMKEPMTYPLGEMGSVIFGPGYRIIHQLNRIPYDNVKLMVYPEGDFARFPAFQMQTNRTDAAIKGYFVVPVSSHLFVILELSDGGKRIDLFHRNSSSLDWISAATESLQLANGDQIVSTSNNLFQISPASLSVTILSPENGRIHKGILQLPERLGSRVVTAAQQNFIAIYDDHNIFLIHRRDKRWTVWYERAPSFLQESRNFLDKFDILPELREGYLKQLDSVTFKANENTLVLSSPTITNEKTFLHVEMMRINSNYKISNRWSHWIPGEIITDMSHVLKNKEGSNFTMKYKMENSKFGLKVTAVAGKVREGVDGIRNRNKKADALEKLLKDLNDHEQWSNLMKNMTILKWQKLGSQFCPQGLSAGEEFLISTNDGALGLFPSSNKLRLTAHMTLWQKERTGAEMEIMKGEESLKSIKVEPAWNIVFALPFFFAYQSGSNVKVIPLSLDGRGIGEEITFENELVNPQTNARLGLITTRSTRSGHHASSNEIMVRPPTLFQRPQIFLVSKLTRIWKDVERVTGYEYEMEKKKTRVIPGGDRLISGWMDISFDDGRAQTISYNTKGVQVKAEDMSKTGNANSNSMADEESPEEYFLKDRRNAKVFSSYPYKLDSDMVSFISFEEYEKDSKAWTYDKSQVVRNRQSFTGRAYADLTSTMEGRFTPVDQNGQFVAGTWVRLPSRNDVKIGHDAPFLKVIYLYPNSSDEIIGLFGKVMLSMGDWLYAEVTVDLPYAKAEVYAPVLNVSLMNFQVPITLKIVVSPGDLDDRVHVDSVAIYPSGFNFEASVYNHQAHVPLATDVIGSSGNVRRFIYGRNGQKIAESDNDVVREMRIKQLGSSQSHPFESSVTFEARQGFQERWEKSSFRTKWEIENGHTTLKTSNTGLSGVGKLSLRNLSTPLGFAIRFDYVLGVDSSLTLTFGVSIGIKTRNGGGALIFQNAEAQIGIPLKGEVVVYFADGRTVVWIDGKNMIDKRVKNSNYSGFISVEMTRGVKIKNVVFLEDPAVKVVYSNGLSKAVQELNIESATSAIVSHSLYNSLGQPFLKTRATRIIRQDVEPLLAHYSNFVESYSPNARTLNGDVTRLNPEDDGFPYYYIEYEDHPQGSALNRGLPGKNYSLGGSFSSETVNNHSVPFLQNLFPPDDGFHFKSTSLPNGKQIFNVFKDGLTRATYIKAPMYDHRLTTYEYNESGQLIAVLPSEYHKAVDTFARLTPYETTSGPLANIYGTFYTYDEQGRLKKKRNREEGTIHFLYDQFGQVRFRVYQPFGKETFAKTIFTYYSPSGILQRSGLYTKKLEELAELEPYLGDNMLPLRYTQAFQDFAYYTPQVAERDRMKQIFTQGESGPVVEEVVTDAAGEVARKSVLIAPTLLSSTVNLTISENWINQRTKRICHPGESVCFLKTYNQLGHLVSIKSEENLVDIRFEYNAMGQVVNEDSNGFARRVQYNSPGYVTSIEDNFVSYSLSYEENGYTVLSPGAGMASRLKITPKWASSWKKRTARLDELKPPNEFDKSLWSLCLAGLRRIGCLDKHNVPTAKIYNPSVDIDMPLQCGGKSGYRLSNILSSRSPPGEHGYKVDHGSHGEILRAKYWRPNQDQTHEPLQPHTFSDRISGVSMTESIDIWKNLVSADIIIVNQPTKDLITHIGTLSNIPVFREDELTLELRKLDIEASQFSDVLMKLLARYHRLQKSVPEKELEKRILQWSGFEDGPAPVFLINKRKQLSKQIHKMIHDKRFDVEVLSSEFLQALEPPYQDKALDIAMVLLEHQEQALGSHPFDEDVLDVDLNGNQKTFLRGHTIYHVQYRNDSTQQIEKLTKTFGGSSVDYAVNYDDDGNVVEAGHKAIKKILYHPVIKRPTYIEMQEGTKIIFAYDGQGERLVKQVYTPSGYLSKEILYIRDERARVVMEKVIVREESTDSVVSVRDTHFFYGPRGLVGFLRDGDFYNVMTDHLGSVRMVTKGQEVVAVYDYMLYGELQSSYVSDPKGDLNYRFCGKELDAETGLYNFHARLYDPSLGRFFQTDPMWQYSSPYIYAGNSPLSLTDPDGEEVITLIVLGIIGAGVGGYLGGAAVNNRWNPADWDFNDPGTYFGIGGGALAGALLPVGFGASVGVIGGAAVTAGIVTAGSTAATVIGVTGTVTLGVGGAYLLTAASNNKWNPAEWEWDRPHTYNSMFQGFAIGSSIPGGVSQVGNLVTKIADGSVIVSRLLTTANFIAGGGVAYAMGVTAHGGKFNPLDWDWKSPGTYSALFTGFYSGYSLPTLIAGGAKGISKLFSKGRSLKWNGAMLKSALKNPKSPIYKTLGVVAGAYLMGAMANEDFDITSWNFKSFTTYQGILNGAFMGRGLVELIGRLKKPTIKVDIDYTKLRSYSLEHPAAFQKLVEDAMQVLKYLKTKFKVKINVYNKPKLLGDSSGTPLSSVSSSRLSLGSLENLLEQRLASPSSKLILADRRVIGIPCAGGRRRRGLNPSCALSPDSRSDALQRNINKSPGRSLASNAITTLMLDRYPLPVNNELLHFHLHPLRVNQKAFAMMTTTGIVNAHVHNTAYYLNTGETITIPASPVGGGENRMPFSPLVVTPELGGCSLYVKHNPDANTLSIFHHFRHYSHDTAGGSAVNYDKTTGKYIVRNPVNGLDEVYNDVLSFEEYHRDSGNPVERPWAATTAFIYYENGRWHFGNQMLSYSYDTGVKAKTLHLTKIKLEGYSSRFIYGVPGADNVVLTPPGSQSRGPPAAGA